MLKETGIDNTSPRDTYSCQNFLKNFLKRRKKRGLTFISTPLLFNKFLHLHIGSL